MPVSATLQLVQTVSRRVLLTLEPMLDVNKFIEHRNTHVQRNAAML